MRDGKAIETLSIEVRIEAPAAEPPRPYSAEAADALQAAADAAQDAVRQTEGVRLIGAGYGIPRRKEWRPA